MFWEANHDLDDWDSRQTFPGKVPVVEKGIRLHLKWSTEEGKGKNYLYIHVVLCHKSEMFDKTFITYDHGHIVG